MRREEALAKATEHVDKITCDCGVIVSQEEFSLHLDDPQSDPMCWAAVKLRIHCHLHAFKGNRQGIDYTTHVLLGIMRAAVERHED